MATQTHTSNTTLAQACADHMWQNDTACQHLGMVIEVVDVGFSRISMAVTETMLNGFSICHGGYLFALADSCFAYACNSENQPSVAAGCTIDFIRPAKLGDTLTATSTKVNRGRSTGLYDVAIINQDRKVVAQFRGRSHQIGDQMIDPNSY